MDVLPKKYYKKNDGYLLLESLIAMVVVSLLVVGILPLFLFMGQQRAVHREKLEAARFLMELSEIAVDQAASDQELIKVSNGLELVGNFFYQDQELMGLGIETKGKKYAIYQQASKR